MTGSCTGCCIVLCNGMRLGARFFSTIRLLVRGERVLTPKPEWELCLFEFLLECDNITEKSGVVLFEHAKLTTRS